MKGTLLPILGLFLLGGCATPGKQDLSAFQAHPPRSIAVVPPMNESAEITAPGIFVPSLATSLAERGYYVFPVPLTDTLLRDQGLGMADQVQKLPPRRFYELFGADAVLFVTIREWSTTPPPAPIVKVHAQYRLIDTRTGTPLWQGSRKLVRDGSNPGGGLIGAVISPTTTPESDYRSLAREANATAFLPPLGIPAGPYHPDFGWDRASFQ